MSVGLKEKVQELVQEDDQQKREELGREILLFCQEMHKLVDESHALITKVQKLQEGFID